MPILLENSPAEPVLDAAAPVIHDANAHLEVAPDALAPIAALDEAHAFQNYGARLPVAFSHGLGARLWDVEGREYLDFLAGIAVTTVGHAHPHVVEAIARQAGQLLHTTNYYFIEPQAKLAQKLTDLVPHDGVWRAFFCNSGTEANEAALKLARKRAAETFEGEKTEVVTVWKSFHGRTYGSLAATGNEAYQKGFAPLPAGFQKIELNDTAALKAVVTEKTCAVMLEPILGESGVLPCTQEFLEAAREVCDQSGALLIFDAVQTSNGRTGAFWGHEWSGVAPDVFTIAKGLANGVPIGAVVAREEIAAHLTPGSHGTTFGGNFLACAAALATLEVIEDENLMQNAQKVGAYFQKQLQNWGEATGALTEVRGRGLMVGAQLSKPLARELMKESLSRGLVFNAVGDSILRFLPPLIISESDVDEAMAKLSAAWDVVK